MSFEGYDIVICKNGHLDHRDPYFWYDGSDWTCSDCGCKEVAWAQTVDETNGESHGHIDMEQFLVKPAKWGWRFKWNKMTKGFVKVETAPAIYRVPTKSETKRAQQFRDWRDGKMKPVYQEESHED